MTTFPYPESSYFAVQVFGRRDVAGSAAAAFLRGAAQVGITFRRLDFLDTFTVGTTEFARFRADLINAWPVLDRLFEEGRSVIGPGGPDNNPHGFLARLTSGKTGSVNFNTMQAAPRALRTFRGTALDHWERQFRTA